MDKQGLNKYALNFVRVRHSLMSDEVMAATEYVKLMQGAVEGYSSV